MTLTAVSLAMDAFAVSICKGLAVPEMKPRFGVIAGSWFGAFQALMPVIGYFAGSAFAGLIDKYDHWVVFIILGIIGANMIREAFGGAEPSPGFSPKIMLPLAVATSIDALAVGVSFAFMKTDIRAAAAVIGVITFAISAAGVWVGSRFGAKYKAKAEIAGGIVLILIGTRILVTSLI